MHIKIQSVAFIVFMLIISGSCNDKEPAFESGTPLHNAAIRVYAFDYIDFKEIYREGIEISLYEERSDMSNNVRVVRKGKTDAAGHTGFYNLDGTKYYIQAIDPHNPHISRTDEISTPKNTVSFVYFVLNED